MFSISKRRLMPIVLAVLAWVASLSTGLVGLGGVASASTARPQSALPQCKYVTGGNEPAYKHTAFTSNPTTGTYQGLHVSILATEAGLTVTYTGYPAKIGGAETFTYTPQSTMQPHNGLLEWNGSGCTYTFHLPPDIYVGIATLTVYSMVNPTMKTIPYDLYTYPQGEPKPTDGYWLLTGSGYLDGYGTVAGYTTVPSAVVSGVVGMASAPSGAGLWLATYNGHVYQEEGAQFQGSPVSHGIPVGNTVVGIASDPSCSGYWVTTSTGHVYSFGCAQFQGSPVSHGIPVGNTVVGIASDPSCSGYLVYTSNGHVYNYGCAPFLGSPVSSQQVVNDVLNASFTPDGNGYWVFTKSGTVQSFGDATDLGVPSGSTLVAAASAL